jgi:hypothetical protein
MTRASASVVLTRGLVRLVLGRGALVGVVGRAGRPILGRGLGLGLLRLGSLDALEPAQRISQALLALGSGALARGAYPPRAGTGLIVDFLLQRLHLIARVLHQLLQPLAAPEARGLGMRADAQAVLRHAVHRHRALGQQRGHAAREMLVQPRGLLDPEVAERVVVTSTPPHSRRSASSLSHSRASSRAEPTPSSVACSHSATRIAGSMGGRPGRPSAARMLLWR